MSPKIFHKIDSITIVKTYSQTQKTSTSNGPGNGNTVMTDTKPPLCERSPVRGK
jgi:hypothetical protein